MAAVLLYEPMRLHQIEITGFKSFPERSRLAFDGGVTAIVGPNGCGKSNIIDAISWVLGDQNPRSLRGDRMEDVIFSGSDGRRPTATAEVRLQLSQVTAALAAGRLARQGSNNGHGGSRLNGAAGAAAALLRSDGTAAIRVNGADREDTEAATLNGAAAIGRDIEVGRRLYRSGESEYLIDGSVCRLRDIQDLMMDSGVGLKAYAVIEQGKIGQILSARPQERRMLLEEVAGITKYKSRRRAAVLKLEAAQQDLTRVNDIVFEVEQQRSALKRQAAKARRYRRLREALRRWEKVHFARRHAELAEVLEAARREAAAAREVEVSAVAGVDAAERADGDLQRNLIEAEERSAAAREAAHEHALELGRRRQQIDFDRRQIEALGEVVAEGEQALRQLEERRVPMEAELEAQRCAADECVVARAAARGRLQEIERQSAAAQQAIDELDEGVDAARREVFAAINARTTLQHVIDSADGNRQRIGAALSKLSAEADDLATECAKADAARGQVDDTAQRTRQALDAVRQAAVETDERLVSIGRARDKLADQVRVREQQLTAATARMRSVEELLASRRGYSDAARLVLSHGSDDFTHCGSVADHLSVDREHEPAVEAALGDLLQHVVVPSQSDADAALRLAASRQAGRCGCLVVDALPCPALDGPPHPDLVPLSTLVVIDGAGATAVQRLLGRCWRAPSDKAARAAAETTCDPVATPDGRVYHGAAIVQDGGKMGGQGILATKREIHELRARIESQTAALAEQQSEWTAACEVVERAEADRKRLDGEQHQQEKVLIECEMRLASLDGDRTRVDQKRTIVENEQRRALEEQAALEARQREARQAIARVDQERQGADARFSVAQEKLSDARTAAAGLVQRLTEAKADHVALVERAAALAVDVKRIEDAAHDLERQVAAQTDGTRRATADRSRLVAAVADAERQLNRAVAEEVAHQDEVRASDAQVAGVRQRLERHVERLREARFALETARAEIGRVDVRCAAAETDLTNLETACGDALQLTLQEVCDEVEREGLASGVMPLASGSEFAETLTGEDREDDDAQPSGSGDTDPSSETAPSTDVVIAALRERIERLGPVNMMAIEQFDELEQRITFLTDQRQDLLESVQSTTEAIERIDATTRERFADAFAAVNTHFQETFATLFGGGRAGLVALEESGSAESGLDIVAQPPGKRLQSIQLLSGGEKALTAMALMFAIFKYRPSPFCLLDEIDAPLDDANIGRFVEMLRGMQDRTQFVLVTHNRKTMEIADRLYGVTMEEPGVSKLISVEVN